MSEQSLAIPVGNVTLEARYQEGTKPGTFVLCHPHPLYGGDMDNNVVTALGKGLNDLGWSVLRFNFRGVGGSGGQYRNKDEETEDLLAVEEFLEKEKKGPVHLAAYSFGAWAALKAAGRGLRPETLVLVSLPVDFMDCSGLKLPAVPTLLTVGDRDDFCRPESLRNWLREHAEGAASPRIELLEGCSHFYGGHERRLMDSVKEFMLSGPASA